MRQESFGLGAVRYLQMDAGSVPIDGCCVGASRAAVFIDGGVPAGERFADTAIDEAVVSAMGASFIGLSDPELPGHCRLMDRRLRLARLAWATRCFDRSRRVQPGRCHRHLKP